MSYTDNTIIITDLMGMGAGGIHVHTRKILTDAQLSGLADIPGVTDYDAGKQFAASIRVHYDFPRSYTQNVRTGHAFTFQELAPQIALVMADALEIDLDQLDVRVEHSPFIEQLDGLWVVEAARKLRPKSTPKNPYFEFAATLNDIETGVELMKVNYAHNLIEFVTPDSQKTRFDHTSEVLCISAATPVKKSEYHIEAWYLSDMGIIPYGERSNQKIWNQKILTIVNSAENRRALVRWLIRRGGKYTTLTAQQILTKYPNDFEAKIVIHDGELAAVVIM